MAEPAKLPDWATDNPIDPTSGQPAIIEPSPAKKLSGFTLLEQPSRQDFNYQFNLIGQWIEHFKTLNAVGIKNVLAGFEYGTGVLDEGAGSFSISVSHGIARSADNLDYFDSRVDGGFPAGSIKKYITGGSFTKGNDGQGLSAGISLSDDTWYHVFIVRLPDNDIDIGFDTDINAANLIANELVSSYRRISSFYWTDSTVGAGDDNYLQVGDRFTRKSAVGHQTITIVGGQNNAGTLLRLPPSVNLNAEVLVNFENFTDTATTFFTLISTEQDIPSTWLPSDAEFETANPDRRLLNLSYPTGITLAKGVSMRTDVTTDGQINVYLKVKSYMDLRGKESI